MELDGPLDEVSMENASSYRFYLFECLECRLFFDSPDAVRKHHEEMNHRGDVRVHGTQISCLLTLWVD